MSTIRVSSRRYSFEVLRDEADPPYPRGALVSGPHDIVEIARHLIGADITEVVLAFFLDARHRLTGHAEVVRGTLNAARLSPRDILVRTLAVNAAAVALAHNHPSSEVSPSRADRLVTTVLRDACDLVGIPLLDHVIVTDSAHYSFRESERWPGPEGR
jgi:DNA repair protein RadC